MKWRFIKRKCKEKSCSRNGKREQIQTVKDAAPRVYRIVERRSINIPGSGCPRDTVRGIGMDIGLQDESCSLN